MTSARSVELRWQQEVIERWLNTAGIPENVCAGLRLMLQEVLEEMGELESSGRGFEKNGSRWAS